jgi:hypothetical protein
VGEGSNFRWVEEEVRFGVEMYVLALVKLEVHVRWCFGGGHRWESWCFSGG